MRYSQLFGRTKLEAPHDSDSINAKYLTQAGFVDKLAAGIYYLLPLGMRVVEKVKQIIREEMNAVDGQEMLMPALHPVELWETTGRLRTMNDILYKTKGAGDKDFVFGPSHEEAVTPIAKKFIQSYKDLPLCVYQIQTKFRNEPRAKSGMLRGREFGMKDMYSFHTDEKDLDQYYEKVKQAYLNVYKRCGLEAYVVEASGGAFTTKLSHEFSVVTPAGEDTIILCRKCGIAQNLEIAEGKVRDPEQPEEKELEMKEVAMKYDKNVSINENAKAHNVPAWKVLKTVVYVVEGGGLLGVVIRGDLAVNEIKLVKYLQKNVRPATAEELQKDGLVQGFISPVGHGTNLRFIADHSIRNVKNFLTGANKKDTDLINVNFGRDFTIADFADLVFAEHGFRCPKCGGESEEVKAVEAGNIFKLGTKYSENFDLYYTDEKGERKLVIMGCYGIGTTRMMGTAVEASHDDKGIIWPKTIAPFLVHLISLGGDETVKKAAETLYQQLKEKGVEILFDDRDESAGKKFNDADMIGIPLRLTVSNRTLKENSVEWKLRSEKEAKLVLLDGVVEKIMAY